MKKIKEKKERALGAKLFLKADRCNSPKCATIRRPERPGMHGQKRHSLTEYGTQLREKQKFQITYGLSNRQTSNLFKTHEEKEQILTILEKRLDRVIFLLGLAKSPRIARQLVSHGHIAVNGRKVTVPSYVVKVGDTIEIKKGSEGKKIFDELETHLKQYDPPAWLKLDTAARKGEVSAEPKVDQSNLPFDINLIGEYFARR